MTDRHSSADMRSILVEVGLEEIPSQYLRDIIENFGHLMRDELRNQRLNVSNLQAWATPRRLVVRAWASKEQEALRERVRGPLLANAYKDDEPTPALLGFCRRVGVSPGDVTTIQDGSKTYIGAEIEQPIHPLEELLAPAVQRAFAQIPLVRSMRWGHGDYRFIRPVRWCSLWVEETFIPLVIAGVPGSAETYGNRTNHPEALAILGTQDYDRALDQGLVMVDQDKRRKVIETQARGLARSVSGYLDPDEELLEEVTQLVEWPTPFLGRFDEVYLEIPEPILVTSMRVHQRYFPVHKTDGTLLPYFIGVRNGIGDDLDMVRHGNEKVLRARLSDALYFYRTDLGHALADHRPQLDRVIFHAKLGTYGDKIARIHSLFDATRAAWPLNETEKDQFKLVIDLYKADLLTQVVQEFPELQGVMGEIYAQAQKFPNAVAVAIGEQYHPGHQGDRIPHSVMGQILVLLDRLDTVLEGVANGLKPTGSEDPFGMRRSALAIGRVLSESEIWQEPAYDLFMLAAQLLNLERTAADESYDLVLSRLEYHLDVTQGIPAQKSRAILAAPYPWCSYPRRLAFLDHILADPHWEGVALSFKRIDRVMKGIEVPKDPPEWDLPVEQRVWTVSQRAMAHQNSATHWWQTVQELSTAIDALFDAVLINDPDPDVRLKRGQLLAYAQKAFNLFFDMRQISV